MNFTLKIFASTALLLAAAIFGFFYAWVCSTMWGLDAADPRLAISAMQAMNASVRNAVFAPAFFGTPFIVLITAVLAFQQAYRRAGIAFAIAGLIGLFGGVVLTISINVPMNEALAQLGTIENFAEAQAVWADYSPSWQFWNLMRTFATGLALMLVGYGIYCLGNGAKANADKS